MIALWEVTTGKRKGMYRADAPGAYVFGRVVLCDGGMWLAPAEWWATERCPKHEAVAGPLFLNDQQFRAAGATDLVPVWDSRDALMVDWGSSKLWGRVHGEIVCSIHGPGHRTVTLETAHLRKNLTGPLSYRATSPVMARLWAEWRIRRCYQLPGGL